MFERTAIVVSEHGLHARPASLFTQKVKASGIAVTVTKGDKTANAASILGVISLGVASGQEVVLAASGEGAEMLLDELVELLATVE
jgi:phosphocarrier protein HPr